MLIHELTFSYNKSEVNDVNMDIGLKTRPTLYADQIVRIESRIRSSCSEKRLVMLRMFDRYEELRVIGVVERIDSFKRRFQVNGDWFRIDDVMEAE